jgi:Na+-translocating ferredoxin:NAD+ oxidoreductase RnfG subunit
MKSEQSCGQEFYQNHIYLWKIFIADSLYGYAALDNVVGKMMPITFMVIYDIEFSIIASTIIKYREAYGGAVTNQNWLAQFSGKNSKSDYRIGIDIDAISGATISVSNITKGIRKLTVFLDHYFHDRQKTKVESYGENAK